MILWTTLFLGLIHLGGVICAVEAAMTARTPQGSIAWAVSLVTFPYVALPLYLLFGRSKYDEYVEAMRAVERTSRAELDKLVHREARFRAAIDPERAEDVRTLERLAFLPCVKGNQVRLLVDGTETFEAIFAAIEKARTYVIVQFFIIHGDALGRDLQHRLLAKRREGVHVYVLYDGLGSHRLPSRWTRELREAGAYVARFGIVPRWRSLFNINFRNHRKVVITDGETAFVGGHNAGDEYLGRDARFGPWRDTHLSIRGPAVEAVQLAFALDWYWATRTLPPLEWKPEPAQEGPATPVLVLPTGPADSENYCELMFMHAAHAARRRLWITSPYFVPSPAVFESLRLAAVRGVDVRVMLPLRADHLMVYLAAYPCVEHARRAGMRIFRYRTGFLHQKVILVDDDLAAVGTANLDNRSLYLNFEMTTWCPDRAFARAVETMLESDFTHCTEVTDDELRNRGYAYVAATRVARLMAPVL